MPSPNFTTLYQILQISMETSLAVNITKMLQDDAQEYIYQCVEMYTANRSYDIALQIAKLAEVPANDILIAEWTQKYYSLSMKEDLEDKNVTTFIAECSIAFKKAAVSFKDATEFLISHVAEINDVVQKFYSYRIVMSWFEQDLQYGSRREEIEHLMWDAYFRTEAQTSVLLSDYESTFHFVLNGQNDANVSRKIAQANAEKPFTALLSKIETVSHVARIKNVVLLEEPEEIDCWRRVMSHLLELKLFVEAFRLSGLFKAPQEFKYRPPTCPVQIIRTCLKLAEGYCLPYELPQELRLVISSPLMQNKSSKLICFLIADF